jgi:hypothetical protein
MWEPRRLTTLWAFTACYRDSFSGQYLDGRIQFSAVNRITYNVNFSTPPVDRLRALFYSYLTKRWAIKQLDHNFCVFYCCYATLVIIAISWTACLILTLVTSQWNESTGMQSFHRMVRLQNVSCWLEILEFVYLGMQILHERTRWWRIIWVLATGIPFMNCYPFVAARLFFFAANLQSVWFKILHVLRTKRKLAPCSRVSFESVSVIVAQLVKKCLAIYISRRFVTVFILDHYLN